MQLEYNVSTPLTFGKIVKDYLKVLKENTEYPAWTVNDNLELVSCMGIIENNGSWNYHGNYDDSKNELYVIFPNRTKRRMWFSLNKEDAIKIQQENIEKWRFKLQHELDRLGVLESKKLL